MDYTGKRVKIINLDGWKDTNYQELESYLGKIGTVKHDCNPGGTGYRLELTYDDGFMAEIDNRNGRLCFREENIEVLDNTYNHEKQSKLPLGIMPKKIFEWHRVIELCRALHEYSLYEDVDQHLMIKWSDELNDRLYGLKSNKSNTNNDDESWESNWG